MKKPLLYVIFASDKRNSALLLLQDGPKEMKFILEALGTSRQSLLPQIRILEEHHLVSKIDDSYMLTKIGELIVEKMVPLSNTIKVFDSDIDYWGSRKLDFIPSNLLQQIKELGKCDTVNPPVEEVHYLLTRFQEASARSKSLFGVTTFFHPNFKILFSELIQNKVSIYTIITPELHDKLVTQYHEKFKGLLENYLFHAYEYPGQLEFLSFAFNDNYLLLSLLNKEEYFDNKHYICSSKSALGWGKELFEYYLKNSTPITEL
ncbi:helix-turn-helix transcriptional regulator [Methanolobus halotolerans]|uniref:Transcriptional regulator n=1 Tax=Methanolobus halotolerans TaxID=2052935 RepID=A0A4E0Q2G1_9EURY|nr:winged helix-turn-helix domain-containing protein [Methanolobus halotolerans]TGC06982.1 transcriptional regulator [Methanolobus halotolerans]